MTAIIATIFTMPFIIAHFGYVPLYGLIGNIILLPIFSIAIMPMIMIGTICALFNYHFLINLSHNVYQFTLTIAESITNLPHANIQMPYMSNTVLVFMMTGLLCLIFIINTKSHNYFKRNLNYVLCGLFVLIAIAIYTNTDKPLFYATDDHQLVAFNVNDKLEFNKARASKHYFAFETWYKINKEERPDKNKRFKCDHGLCKFNTPKWKLVYMQNFKALFDNIENVCRDKSVNFIVGTFNINAKNCHGKILNNGLLIYPNGHVSHVINHRLWHNQHQQNKDHMPAH